MYEIFLFVNPLGIACYRNEQVLREFFDDRGARVCVTFIPIVSPTTVADDMRRKGLPTCNFTAFRKSSENTYEALRLFHAIKQTSGNKKARSFIYDLQKQVNSLCLPYSTKLASEVADRLGLDFEKILAFSHNASLQKSISNDQDIADRYQIQRTPTAVIFNEDSSAAGVLIEGSFDKKGLEKALVNQISGIRLL